MRVFCQFLQHSFRAEVSDTSYNLEHANLCGRNINCNTINRSRIEHKYWLQAVKHASAPSKSTISTILLSDDSVFPPNSDLRILLFFPRNFRGIVTLQKSGRTSFPIIQIAGRFCSNVQFSVTFQVENNEILRIFSRFGLHCHLQSSLSR